MSRAPRRVTALSFVAATWLSVGAIACAAPAGSHGAREPAGSHGAREPERAALRSESSEPDRATDRAPGSAHEAELEAEVEPLRWEVSEPAARERARRARLPMLVYLRADWAVASVRMEREVWTDPRVIREARAFVALKIDLTRADGDAELYAERYEAPGVPAVLLFDVDGQRVGLVHGQTETGEILNALRRAAE